MDKVSHISLMGYWLERLLAVLDVDGLGLLTETQRCDGLHSPYA